MTELLPTHFWQAVSSKTKYDHWQATFNTWVCLKGSAPSIQTMKNKIDKISKIVRSTNPGATFDMQPWFGLVDIARYLVNHKLEASASQREEESMITTNHHHFLDNQSRHKNPIRLQASASSSKMTCHSIVQLVDMSFPGSAYQSQCHHRGQSPIDGEDEENMNEAVEIAPTYYLDSSATSCQLVGSDSRMPQAYNQQEVALLQDKSLIISEPSDFTIFDNSTIEWEETTQLPALTEIEIESLGVYTLGSDK